MRTRSGKTYEFNKCRCGKYYKTPIFKNRCSLCFSIKYPEKWQKIINWYTKEYGARQVFKRKAIDLRRSKNKNISFSEIQI